jgi:hypothetical protein
VTAHHFIPAAQYLCMSTERQQYSFENQTDAMRKYAENHDLEVVQTNCLRYRAHRTYRDLPYNSAVQILRRPERTHPPVPIMSCCPVVLTDANPDDQLA